MTYEDVRSFAALAGMLIFIALFIGVLIYAFWPGNKDRFERARHVPLDDDRKNKDLRLESATNRNTALRGENGR